MKSRILMLMFAVMGSLSFSACGGGSKGSSTPPSSANEWTWMDGSNIASQPGTYGTQGTAAVGNVPGARSWAVSGTDPSGNFWFFGGNGQDSTEDGAGYLNDLWEYSPSAGQWTWVSGANVAGQSGTYGTQGTATASNVPGARGLAASWIDASGNFWLFGGLGFDLSSQTNYQLNDLWKYSAGEWTWMSGANAPNQLGTYGTQGTAASGNVPGARNSAVSWIDTSGNLWLFGGYGYDSAGNNYLLNDLWQYSAKSGLWTWMSGSNIIEQRGVYGVQGTPDSNNAPGARESALSWTDESGNLWLFGGGGYDSTGTLGYLNDLWKYGAGEWTWMGGANVVGQAGTYGAQGTAGSSNSPGGRGNAVGSVDASGNFWLYGGAGYDSTATQGELRDLWKYSAGEWTWVSGSDVVGEAGTYGTQGLAAASNNPGARLDAVSWVDASGNLWFFGGYYNPDPNESGADFNDLWKYAP